MLKCFAEKNVSSFCSAKATLIFSAKNIRILCIESAKTVNEMTLNKLVKLTMLWTTGPWYFSYFSIKTCCGYSLEMSQWVTSTGYLQHMFLLRNKKIVMWIPSLTLNFDLSTFHSHLKMFTDPVNYLLICLKNCWMSVKQCRFRSDAAFCSIWSGSTLFYIKVFKYDYLEVLDWFSWYTITSL